MVDTGKTVPAPRDQHGEPGQDDARTRAATYAATPIYDALVARWQALGREVPGRPDATGTRRGEPADLFGRG